MTLREQYDDHLGSYHYLVLTFMAEQTDMAFEGSYAALDISHGACPYAYKSSAWAMPFLRRLRNLGLVEYLHPQQIGFLVGRWKLTSEGAALIAEET